MLMLDIQHIRMNQQVENKARALELLANILVEDGLVHPNYLKGLQDREQQGSTYLGQGIAIPHGTPQSRDAILHTGIRLVHFPEGIIWDGEHPIYLAVVIAAKSDEHLQVLQLLTRALSANIKDLIRQATSPEQILHLLQATPPSLLLHERLIDTAVGVEDIEGLIWQAYQLLRQQQCVKSGFFQHVSQDKAIHLGHGVWSLNSSHDNLVNQSAVSVVKPQQPLLYQDQVVNTLLLIAGNQHMATAKLAHLVDLLLDEQTQQQLQEPKVTAEVAGLLGAELIPDWPASSVTLPNPLGLHARPANVLVNITKHYKGDIQVCVNDGQYVSAKSLSKLLSLGCQRGNKLTFIAEPNTDAEQALPVVIDAIKQGLGEEVEEIAQDQQDQNADVIELLSLHPESESLEINTVYHAIGASSGLAFGLAHVVKPLQFNYERHTNNIKQCNQQLDDALTQVKNDIHQLISHADNQDIKQIFMAHLEMLDDPELHQSIKKLIKTGLTAAAATHEYIEKAAQAQASLNNKLLAERAADLRDIGYRVLAVLCGVELPQEPEDPYILVMHDVGPGDVARLDKERVAGILTAVGGASAHSAIVARALGIPAIVGAGQRVLDIENKQRLLIDGDLGLFELEPTDSRIAQTQQQREQQNHWRELAEQQRFADAPTVDDHRIEIAANLGNVHDTVNAVDCGAEAIGLLRTELVFMSHSQAPNEQTQEKDYRIVLDALAGRPLVVRTLDIGGDKPLPYLAMPSEENPFLGVRGIRLTLRKPNLLRTQLRALLKAADGRPLRIMFPMIGRVEEWRDAKAILDEVRAEFPCPDLQVGIMIEVPSAALLAPILAKEVDFFSIGTNDLTQYTLAVDRGHPLLSAEADGLHPSILQLINITVQAAHQHGKWVGICGELAAERKAVPILLGLGVDELSMSPRSIPLVKAQIRTLNFTHCQTLANQALSMATAAEVRTLVN